LRGGLLASAPVASRTTTDVAVTPNNLAVVTVAAGFAQTSRELFHDEIVACSKCHEGERFTNNTSADVGTGGEYQVPSLLDIAYRAPFMHDGCAATLRQRFDPNCGGEKHGETAALSEAQLSDLIVYLESL
jgi:cytochrome c peroxidase